MRRKKSFFDRREHLLGKRENSKGLIKGKFKYREATLEELSSLKITLINRRKKQARITLIVAIICTLFAFGFLANFLGNIKEQENSSQLVKEKKYKETLAFGDQWLEKRHWRNALFFYHDAAELMPDDFAAPARIILTHCYACEDIHSQCDSARKHLDLLSFRSPRNPGLIELEKALEQAQNSLPK